MALLASTYSALVSALGSSSSADDILQYINYLNLVNQQVDPGSTVNVGIPGSTGYILGIPGSSISVEQIDVDLVPTASSTNKTAYGTSVSSSLSGSFNIGTAAGGASGSDLGGATNLKLDLSNTGSGQRAQMINMKASSSNAGTGAVGLMENAAFSVSSSSGSSTSKMRAFHADVTVPSGATATDVISFESSANLAGTITNYTGVQISPSGSSPISGQVNALSINLNGLTGIPLGGATALSINTGRIATVGNFIASNNMGNAQYHLMQNGLQINSGSPLSGTDMIINDFGTGLDANDNYTINGTNTYGFGVVGLTAGMRVFVASGKTVGGIVSNAAGIQVQTGSVGTLTDLTCNLAGVARNLASTGTITNAYGYRVTNASGFKLSGAPVTNAWGISIEDTGAENFLAKCLAIGTASKKVSASTVGFEMNDKNLLLTGTAKLMGSNPSTGLLVQAGATPSTIASFYNDGTEKALQLQTHLAMSGDNTKDIGNFEGGLTDFARPRNIYVGTSVRLPDGAQGTPSVTFTSDTSQGFFRDSSTNLIAVAGASTPKLQWGSSTAGATVPSSIENSSANNMVIRSGGGSLTMFTGGASIVNLYNDGTESALLSLKNICFAGDDTQDIGTFSGGPTDFRRPRLVYVGTAVKVGAAAVPAASAGIEIDSSTKAMLFSRMSTAERDALTAVNGMVVYNSSTDKLQVRAAGSWVDLH